ncbi:MAG: hypothetical protein MK226_01190 [Saprospiraceae bacterium]|nr:hypothetical protein [Saprospiraceae bacterium]
MMRLSLFVLTVLIITTSCSNQYRRYQTSAYEELENQHNILAVLPVETLMTGRISHEMSDKQIEAIEMAESKAFQVALYDQLARRSGSRRGEIRVNFQHYSQTNALLQEAGISYKDAQTMAPGKLAEILQVDAVVRTRVQKEKYLTDLESFGIQLAQNIAFLTNRTNFGIFASSRTSDVLVSISTLDTNTGVPTWTLEQDCPTFWNKRTAEIIEDITVWTARRFPYRNQ